MDCDPHFRPMATDIYAYIRSKRACWLHVRHCALQGTAAVEMWHKGTKYPGFNIVVRVNAVTGIQHIAA